LASQREMDLDGQMREVLIQLALTSNGNTAKMDSNGGGGHYADALLVGWLDPHDAPHAHYLDMYMRQEDDDGRRAILERAKDTLDGIRFSRAHGGELETETIDDLYDRIVTLGVGWSCEEVAVALRTTTSIVRKARVARGRDQSNGRPLEKRGRLPVGERRTLVSNLSAAGRDAREVSRLLGVSYSTVLRDLGKKT
jgi:hypothetical protein